MFIGSTRESQDERAKLEVAARREAAAAFPFVRPVLRQFNGKVCNCRFEKALQEATEGKAPGRIYARKDGYWVTVNYYPSVGNPGSVYGLIFYGNMIIPFIDRFPHQTELYRIMSSKLEDLAENPS